MKKILSALLIVISVNAKAQTIDTVLVRNLQLQATDWAWYVGKHISIINSDSTAAFHYRRIRDRIRAVNPASFATNVTIDSLPGFVVLDLYKTTKTANAGEIVTRYTAIVNAIEAKTNMTFFIAPFNANISADYTRSRDLGKHVIMDN